MSDNLPKAIWSGSFIIGSEEIKCHVLDSGQRIIESDSVAKLFTSMDSGIDEEQLAKFATFIKGKGIPSGS